MRTSRALVFVFLSCVAAQPASGAHSPVASDPSRVVFDSNQDVQRFYGIPIDLTLADLKRLRFPTKVRYERGEDSQYSVYRVSAHDGVHIELTFDSDGKLSRADTKSSKAIGPKGIRVGSLLSEVRSAWPNGKLLYGNEDGAFVTFVTGTNVLYLFDPNEMPPQAFDPDYRTSRNIDVPDIKVKEIRLYRR